MKKRNILSVATVAVTVLLSLVLAQPSIANSGSMDDAATAIIANDTNSLEVSIDGLDVSINTLIDQQYGLLHIAAMAGNSGAIELLLSAGADIDVLDAEHGWTALMHAAHLGHAHIVEYLMERGADKTVVGSDLSTAEVLARFSGVSQLFEGEANKRTHGQAFDTERLNEMLLRAAEVGDLELAGVLLDNGADPNTRSSNSWNVLLYSAFRNDWDAFEYFLSRGSRASLNQPASWTEAALLGASQNQNFKENTVIFLNNISTRFNREYSNPATESQMYRYIGYRKLAHSLDLDQQIVDIFYEEPKIMKPVAFELLVKPEMTVDDWRRTQTYLRNLGLYRGNIDGVPGPLTRNGIFAYYKTRLEEIGDSGAEFCRYSVDYLNSLRSEIKRLAARQGVNYAIINMLGVRDLIELSLREGMLKTREPSRKISFHDWGDYLDVRIIETNPYFLRINFFVSRSGEITLARSWSFFDRKDPFIKDHGDHFYCEFRNQPITNPVIWAYYSDIDSSAKRDVHVRVDDPGCTSGRDRFASPQKIRETLRPDISIFHIDKCDRRFFGAHRAGTTSQRESSDLYLWGAF